MNIIIPIGGVGKRFSDEGYKTPKPLINVLGKPMIYHVIESFHLERFSDYKLTIIYHNTLKNFNFETLINFYFPKLNIHFVCIDCMTKGASETVLKGLETFSDEDLDSNVLVADCDTFYEDDVIDLYKNNSAKSSIFYFEDKGDLPIFSYLSIEDSKVTDIQEKIKISNSASTGLYAFESGRILKKYCIKILNYNKELYLSCVYNEMLVDGVEVGAIEVSNFSCVGTPTQLKSYCNKNKNKINNLRFCFDLDNTLVTHPTINGDYKSVKPIDKNIEFLRMLKNLGAIIIIYTARRMRTHSGNVGAILADVGKITLQTLEDFKIPYDEIYFGKPYANFYIDDLAVNASHNLDFEMGIYNLDIQARTFNDLIFDADIVTKTTSNDGEIFWYQNIPISIRHLFPHIFFLEANTIKMERVDGVTYSYLYTSRQLSHSHLEKLLDTMKIIHNSLIAEPVDIYLNYSTKLEDRISKNRNLYNRYNLLTIADKVISDLKIYETKNLGKVGVIHGDPVFTNIFETNTGLKFIDMRGKQGHQLTLFGDIYYDYAKIYQSLSGYDNILNDIEIDYHYSENMKKHFETNFSKLEIEIIKLITASLIISLIPLHLEDENKFERYRKIAVSLVNNYEI